MNRKTASILIAATVGIAAGLTAVSQHAYADDITMDTSPFSSATSRNDVRADLKKPYPGGYPWSSSYKQAAPKGSTLTREQARAEYLSSRQEVSALNSEDGGAAYLNRTASRSNPTATMGGSAR
ncbi:hypothetical protein [Caenimonas soli]|uniref:hypothetical protein n=1 Tax=Caenimonas soli TaxID=2735555 RepID=UPI001554E2E4|nr:hypothetical protein [Caenimonas soli]NPC54361.1 hypothetical protein [Caenimonas soli]